MSIQDSSANALEMMSEATEATAGMLPSDMIHAITELVDPASVAKEMPWLAGGADQDRPRSVRHLA